MTIDVEAIMNDAGASEPIAERVNKILQFFRAATGVEPENMVLSEYVEQSGKRVYESVFLFEGGKMYEAKDIMRALKLDCTPLSNFGYWELSPTDFDDLQNARSSSRLLLVLSGALSATMHASGENCKRLAEVFTKVIRPNVSK